MAHPIHVWRRLACSAMAFALVIGASQINASSPPASPPGVMAPAGSETAYTFEGRFTVDTNLRSASGLSAWAIDAWEVANNIPLPPLGAAFMAAERKYGVNARYLVAHMVLETGWGASYLAQVKKNLFGYNAADRNPIGLATAFPDYATGIDTVAGFIANVYLDPAGRWWGGARTLRGMHRYYATGLYWADSVARIADGLALPTLSAHHVTFGLSTPALSSAGSAVSASVRWHSDGFALPAGVGFVARWRPLSGAGPDPAMQSAPLVTPAFVPAPETNRHAGATTLTLNAPGKAGAYALEVAVVDSDGAPLPDGSNLPITPAAVRVVGPDALAYAATGTPDGAVTLTMTNVGSAPLLVPAPATTPSASAPAPSSAAGTPSSGSLQAWLAPLAGGDLKLLESAPISATLNSGAAVTLALTSADLAALTAASPALLLVRFAPADGNARYADSPPGVYRVEHLTLAPGASPPPTPTPSSLPAPVVTPAPLPTFVPPFVPGPTVPPSPSPAPGHSLPPTPSAGATPSPSLTPSPSPAPTDSPTPGTTPAPTDTPAPVTPAPTDAPTPAPTDTPAPVTPAPTDAPTAAPTPAPTDTPAPPTPDPTAAPTPDPTPPPTPDPTPPPTPDPTPDPPTAPADTPTPDPSLTALVNQVRAQLALYQPSQSSSIILAAAPLLERPTPSPSPSASPSVGASVPPLVASPSPLPISQSLFMVTSLYVADPSGGQPMPTPAPIPTPASSSSPGCHTIPAPVAPPLPSPLVAIASSEPLNPVDQPLPVSLLSPSPSTSPSTSPSASPAPSPAPLVYGFSAALDQTNGSGLIEVVNQGEGPIPAAIPSPLASPAASPPVASARLAVTAIPVAGASAKVFSFSLVLPTDIPAGAHADFPFALPAGTTGRTSWLLIVRFVPAGAVDFENLPCYLLWAVGPPPPSPATPNPSPSRPPSPISPI